MGESQIKSESEITNHLTKKLNYYAKSQMKSHEMKSNPHHLNPNYKSNHDVNQMATVSDSIVCAKCHQCTSGLTVNVSAKITYGTITEINSLTQLQ